MRINSTVPKLTIRKYGGNDSHSWAVFARGISQPIVTGCTRVEARSHRDTLQQMYEARAAKGSPSQVFEP